MLPDERPALLGMALETELVNRGRVHHLLGLTAMGLVAISTGDLALFDGVMAVAVDLTQDLWMTLRAGL